MRVWLAVVVALAMLSAAGCKKPDEDVPPPVKKTEVEPNFESKFAGFKIWLPTPPTEKKDDVGAACEWTAPEGKGSIHILQVKAKTPRDPKTDTANLADLAKIYLKDFEDFKETGRREFSSGEDAGLEIRGTLTTKEELVLQTILVGTDRYYHLQALGQPPFVDSKEVRDSLKSFRSVK